MASMSSSLLEPSVKKRALISHFLTSPMINGGGKDIHYAVQSNATSFELHSSLKDWR